MKYMIMRNTWTWLAAKGSPGAHRAYDRSQQGAPRIWRVGIRRRLSLPDQAKLVRAGKDGTPITDGVFSESKEFLAGYRSVDVDAPERAYAITARISAAPGPGGVPLNMPIEVRPIVSGPPPEIL